jgi:hypothetical protein
MAVFWDVVPCSLVKIVRRFRGAHCFHHQSDESLVMGAVSTSETSVNIYQTAWRSISEDSHLQTRRRKNLKSHKLPFP